MATVLFRSSDDRVREQRVQMHEEQLLSKMRVTVRAGGTLYGSLFKLLGKVGESGEWVYDELLDSRLELPKDVQPDDPVLIGYQQFAVPLR